MKAIIFDIDGVLVDDSKSYREAIKLTVEKFTGKKPTSEDIEEIKKRPNSNNDWVVSYALAKNYSRDLSKINMKDEEFLRMKKTFQEFYLGGLIDREEILIDKKLIEKIKEKRIEMGFVTSRPRYEALYVLKRIGKFDENLIIAMEDCDEEKPSPKPILVLLERMSTNDVVFVGDTINDELAAKRANVPYENVDENQNINDILERLLR